MTFFPIKLIFGRRGCAAACCSPYTHGWDSHSIPCRAASVGKLKDVIKASALYCVVVLKLAASCTNTIRCTAGSRTLVRNLALFRQSHCLAAASHTQRAQYRGSTVRTSWTNYQDGHESMLTNPLFAPLSPSFQVRHVRSPTASCSRALACSPASRSLLPPLWPSPAPPRPTTRSSRHRK